MKNNILYLVIEIIQLLSKHNCTYKDSEKVLKILEDEIRQQRDEIDLDIVIKNNMYQYINKHISDNEIIKPLYHADPFF